MSARLRRLRPFAIAGAGAVLAASLVGCSNDGDAPTDAESSMGPLDEFMSDMWGEWDEEQANADQMRVEEIVAECMAEQGFDYTPVDWSQGSVSYASEDLDVEWGTLEFAKEYGYGVTTDPWGAQEPVDEGPVEEFVDPNQAYVEAMSATEQEAYYLALYGDQSIYENVEEGEEIEYDWTMAGCQGRGQHEVYESGNAFDDEAFTALQDEMNTMYEAITNDSRLSDLNAEWSSCMADAGYDGLAAIGDAENAFYEKTNVLWEEAYAGLDETATEEDYAAAEAQVQEAMDELTEEEIATAVADYTCREDVRYDEVYAEVNAEHQQEFLDAHRAELEEWKAAYAESTAGE